MAQLASASGLGPEGPVFESQYPDNGAVDFQLLFFLFTFDLRDTIYVHITLMAQLKFRLFCAEIMSAQKYKGLVMSGLYKTRWGDLTHLKVQKAHIIN